MLAIEYKFPVLSNKWGDLCKAPNGFEFGLAGKDSEENRLEHIVSENQSNQSFDDPTMSLCGVEITIVSDVCRQDREVCNKCYDNYIKII